MIGGQFFPSALLRKALAPHCCDFGWLIPGGQDSQLCHAWKTRAFRIFIHNSLAVTITVDYVLDYGFLRFRLQLHVATLQLDIFVYNCMWQYYSGTTF